jgi:hypothetical protein
VLLTERQIRRLIDTQLIHEKRISAYAGPSGRKDSRAACELADIELLDAAKDIDALKAQIVADTPSISIDQLDMVPSKFRTPRVQRQREDPLTQPVSGYDLEVDPLETSLWHWDIAYGDQKARVKRGNLGRGDGFIKIVTSGEEGADVDGTHWTKGPEGDYWEKIFVIFDQIANANRKCSSSTRASLEASPGGGTDDSLAGVGVETEKLSGDFNGCTQIRITGIDSQTINKMNEKLDFSSEPFDSAGNPQLWQRATSETNVGLFIIPKNRTNIMKGGGGNWVTYNDGSGDVNLSSAAIISNFADNPLENAKIFLQSSFCTTGPSQANCKRFTRALVWSLKEKSTTAKVDMTP